jgi:hypothetical protein
MGEVVLGADGKVNMVRCHVCLKIKDKEKLLVPNLKTSKGMLGGVNVRLQNQTATWGNITCLLNHDMQRMSGSFVVGEKT